MICFTIFSPKIFDLNQIGRLDQVSVIESKIKFWFFFFFWRKEFMTMNRKVAKILFWCAFIIYVYLEVGIFQYKNKVFEKLL